jgi:hypothetical protein
MRFLSATLHTSLVMGLTMTPLLCVGPAAAQDVAASVVAGQPSPLPVLVGERIGFDTLRLFREER